MAKAKRRKREPEPRLFDDPGGTPLEWIEVGVVLHDCARRQPAGDPWERRGRGHDDAMTERRRRKLHHLSLNMDEERDDETGSAA